MAALEDRVERLEALLAAASTSPRSAGPVTIPKQPQALSQPAAAEASPFGLALKRLDELPAIQGADAILELVQQHPDHPLASQALFLSAESLFRARELVLADWTFEKVIHDWPGSKEALSALWRRAEIAGTRGRQEEARIHLEALAGRSDAGELAAQAREALEKIGQKKDSAEKVH